MSLGVLRIYLCLPIFLVNPFFLMWSKKMEYIIARRMRRRHRESIQYITKGSAIWRWQTRSAGGSQVLWMDKPAGVKLSLIFFTPINDKGTDYICPGSWPTRWRAPLSILLLKGQRLHCWVFPAHCFRGGGDNSDQSDAAPQPQRI